MSSMYGSLQNRIPFQQYCDFDSYRGLAISPDGREAAYAASATGQSELWKIPLAGGPAVQLTSLVRASVNAVAWGRAGIVFSTDVDGDEQFQLHRIDRDGTHLEPLTDAPAVQHHIHPQCFDPSGRYLAYGANQDSPQEMDVWVVDLETGERRRLLGGEGYVLPGTWSPTGRHLLVARILGVDDTELIVLDVETGETRRITPHTGRVFYGPGPWYRDGRSFLVVTDRDAEFKTLVRMRLDGSAEPLEHPPWNIEDVQLSDNGHYLTWITDEDAAHRVYVRDLRTEQLIDTSAIPPGTILSQLYAQLLPTPDGRRLVFFMATGAHPKELYCFDVKSGALRCLTNGFRGGVSPETLVEPERLRYPTFDGRQVPALLYRPRGAERAPCLLHVHGGPQAVARPDYSPFFQYLLAQGVAILAPNIRGSSGYGQEWQRLIHRDWGGGDLGDLDYAVRYLRSLAWPDPDRLAVMGVSYGGFAALSCAMRLPEYWAAAVSIFGPTNLLTFVESVPPSWRRMIADLIGSPDKDRAMLEARSPITYVDRLRCPLLVVQGENDPRVPRSESEQLVAKLRDRGIPFEYIVLEGEGHGFLKRESELRTFGAAADFLLKYLRVAPDSAGRKPSRSRVRP